MNERGKSDSPVVPAKPPNKAVYAAAEVVEERGLAEGNTRPAQHIPDAEPEQVCRAGWLVCVRLHERTRRHGSRRCCTMSISTVCGRPTGRFPRRAGRGRTGGR